VIQSHEDEIKDVGFFEAGERKVFAESCGTVKKP
jgi:hypothetical protein